VIENPGILSRTVTILFAVLLFFVIHGKSEAAAIPGQPAPTFKLFSINGEPVSTTGLKGSVVLIDFWATWCPPCRESLPFMNELHRKYGKQGLQIIGMNVDEGGERQIKSFVAEKRLSYTIIMAPRKLQDDYGVSALPVIFLINKEGVVVKQLLGFSPAHGKYIENLIKKLLLE
jgi:thiol-disulfide isomerase/thioredoxin